MCTDIYVAKLDIQVMIFNKKATLRQINHAIHSSEGVVWLLLSAVVIVVVIIVNTVVIVKIDELNLRSSGWFVSFLAFLSILSGRSSCGIGLAVIVIVVVVVVVTVIESNNSLDFVRTHRSQGRKDLSFLSPLVTVAVQQILTLLV